MKPVPSAIAALAVAAAAVGPGGGAQAQDVFPSRMLSVLLRNLPGAEFSADPEFVAFLQAAGMKPDLADIVALGMSPTTMSPLGPTRPERVLVDGECETRADVGDECRLRFLMAGAEHGEEQEAALVLVFRLDRRVSEAGARIVGPVRVEVAG